MSDNINHFVVSGTYARNNIMVIIYDTVVSRYRKRIAQNLVFYRYSTVNEKYGQYFNKVNIIRQICSQAFKHLQTNTPGTENKTHKTVYPHETIFATGPMLPKKLYDYF